MAGRSNKQLSGLYSFKHYVCNHLFNREHDYKAYEIGENK